MSILVDLGPEAESQLKAQAQAQNMSEKKFIESILNVFLGVSPFESLTPQERIKELDEWLNSHSYVSAPPLLDEAISRDSIYREREDSRLRVIT